MSTPIPPLFRLWPFNEIYLEQFANSPYSASDVHWFFTVVSCSNLIWLIFLGWKLAFELVRSDVAFPPGDAPAIVRLTLGGTVVLGFAFALGILGFSAGFDTLQDWFLGPSFRQSIAVGAGKIVVLMFGLYFMAAFCIEFGGLGVRYLLAKTLGCLVAEPIPTDGSGAEISERGKVER